MELSEERKAEKLRQSKHLERMDKVIEAVNQKREMSKGTKQEEEWNIDPLVLFNPDHEDFNKIYAASSNMED